MKILVITPNAADQKSARLTLCDHDLTIVKAVDSLSDEFRDERGHLHAVTEFDAVLIELMVPDPYWKFLPAGWQHAIVAARSGVCSVAVVTWSGHDHWSHRSVEEIPQCQWPSHLLRTRPYTHYKSTQVAQTFAIENSVVWFGPVKNTVRVNMQNPCPNCGGTGKERELLEDVLGEYIGLTECGRCRGSGTTDFMYGKDWIEVLRKVTKW